MTDNENGQTQTPHDSELVRVRFTADLDRNRLDAWLAANLQEEFVEIVDRHTGDVLATIGDDPDPFICPECGETAHGIVTAGGGTKYIHGGGTGCEVSEP